MKRARSTAESPQTANSDPAAKKAKTSHAGGSLFKGCKFLLIDGFRDFGAVQVCSGISQSFNGNLLRLTATSFRAAH